MPAEPATDTMGQATCQAAPRFGMDNASTATASSIFYTPTPTAEREVGVARPGGDETVHGHHPASCGHYHHLACGGYGESEGRRRRQHGEGRTRTCSRSLGERGLAHPPHVAANGGPEPEPAGRPE